MQKNKILIAEWTFLYWLFFVLIFFVGVGVSAFNGVCDNMADGIWGAGPVSILLDGLLAILLLYIFLQLNRFSGKVLNELAKIGRNSLYIFSIHTIEMHGIPWYLITESMSGAEMLSYVAIFVLRFVLIVIGVVLVRNMRKMRRQLSLCNFDHLID